MNRNQQALGKAFRKAKGKRKAIVRLGIKPKMTAKAIEKLIIQLAKAKAIEDKVKYETLLDGQQWYVESLVEYSALSVKAQLDWEYEFAFSNVANEDEMLVALKAVA